MDYPNKDNVESDIKSKSLYILKCDDKIVAVAAAGSFNELDHLHWEPKKPCELARIGVIPTMQKQGVGTISEIVTNVNNKEDFIKSVGDLIIDLRNNPGSWENNKLNIYLEAMKSWVEDMDGSRKTPK